MPSGHKEVAWSWRHYRYADDPEGTSEFSLPNLQARLMSDFWTYFTMDPDVRQRDCVLVASRCASRQIRDMHYEARVACVRNWYAEKRKIRMTKAKAREIFMEPWQYLQCPPQYVGQASPEVFRAMVRYWTSTGFKKKHDLGVLKRAALKGGTHTQGNVTLACCIQKKKRETGVEPSLFDVWTDKRMVTDKEDGTKKWVSSCAEIRDKGYRDKYAEVNGKDVDPLTAPFDPEVAMLAGQGKKHGRLWIGDGSVDPLIVPSMRQVRRGRTSDMPQVETRPTVTSTAIDQIRAEVAAERRQREEAEANSRRMEEQIRQQKEMLTQQQQQMAKNEKMMEWMAQNILPSTTNMSSVGLDSRICMKDGDLHLLPTQCELYISMLYGLCFGTSCMELLTLCCMDYILELVCMELLTLCCYV
uniref:Uncharacterized protein n=1 Tax=Avena sativa TaxID=4498 RepID=A0ACD6AAM8_AVESA